MREVLRRTVTTRPDAVWLATTDADSLVPEDWLSRQLAYASQGWDVVLGTVSVTDWASHPAHVPAVYAARYASGGGPHPHVHGANLGIRASAYRAVGGFRPLRTAEDHALLTAGVTRSFPPATSAWRPQPAAAHGRRWASAICSAPWLMSRPPGRT